MTFFQRFIGFLSPNAADVSGREKLLSGFVALFGVLMVSGISHAFVGDAGMPFVVASTGAAAVLLFAAPQSPMSQPWPLVAGHLSSALVGVICYRFVPDTRLAAALAVSLAIVVMYFGRCLHPPGGAAAMGAVLGGDSIHTLGFEYVLMPVGLNIVLLLLFSLIINNTLPGRRYPNGFRGFAKTAAAVPAVAVQSPLFEEKDLHAALKSLDLFLDVSESDLEKIYGLALLHANRRRLGEMLCSDIMRPTAMQLAYATSIDDAWNGLQGSNDKAAVVVDNAGHVAGFITTADIIKYYVSKDAGVIGIGGAASVGSIMSTPVISIQGGQHILDLLALFNTYEFHHVPVVDAKKLLIGMITRADFVKALAVLRL